MCPQLVAKTKYIDTLIKLLLTYLLTYMVACKQAVQGALAAGREKEGELANTSLEFEFHLQFCCGSPSTELSDFRQSARSGNERDCKQTLKNTCQG